MEITGGLDIIVLAGQSNAQGYGFGEVEEEYLPDERILSLCDTAYPHWQAQENGKEIFVYNENAEKVLSVAEEPTYGENKSSNLALFFAKEYIKKGFLQEGRKLLIVLAGVGGTGFYHKQWGTGELLNARMVDLVDYALSLHKDNKIVAFLWHQGECDTVENVDWDVEKRYLVHKQNLSSMFSDFKNRYDLPRLGLISAGFCNEWYQANKTPSSAVLRAIQEICEESGGAFVETKDLASNNQAIGNGDGIHFSRNALHLLGKRYFEAWNQEK